MSPRDNAVKDSVSEADFGDDVYAHAWAAMAKLKGKDLAKVSYVTIESALGLVSTALGVLATYWPVLAAVRAAVDLTKAGIATRENVRKRIAGLRLMQADMLCSLFSLRDFKQDGQDIGGNILPGRLEILCDNIKNDVKKLGNAMENYAAENWLGRILKEKGWKEAVTECGEMVKTRKKEILEVLALYAATRADQLVISVNQTLAPQIASIAIDLKAVQALFDPVEDEQKALDEVKRLDGPEACLKSDSKLNDLAAFIPNDEDTAKRGPLKSKGAGPKTPLSAAEIRRIRTPVEQLLERNLARFESKIDYLVDKAKRENGTIQLIKKLAGARPYERIVDPVCDIRKLWKEMGWGGSIDSHTFVLNLYDYFIDLEREARNVSRTATLKPAQPPCGNPTPPLAIIAPDIPRASSPTTDAGPEDHDDEFKYCTTPAAAAQDAWCLNYFNYRTLSTFMEALDDDMNGLIKIKEVNEFTNAKPKNVTLIQWIVYNAYGWLVAAHLYRIRIEYMIERSVALEYAKENGAIVLPYIQLLSWVTVFLRRLGEPDLDDQQLLKVTHVVMEEQEQSCKNVLGMLNYDLEEEDIRAMMDLSVRGGPGTVGRIEERMFPVLFLVIQRHFEILSLARDYVLEENTFEKAAHTIDCMTDLLIYRVVHLRENFKKLQYDVDRKIQYVANGMFQDMNDIISAAGEEAEYKLTDERFLPWRPERWMLWALQEYDPEFTLNAPSVTATHIFTRDLVRAACASPGEADVGYESVALYRTRYGIRMASSVVAQPPVDASTPTQLDFVLDTPIKPEVPMDTLTLSNYSIDTPMQPETSVDAPTQPEAGPTIDSQAVTPTVYQHTWITCDGCMSCPVVGPRFKCIDCADFDYCSRCYGTLPPPLMHPNAVAGHHAASHRFLRIEQELPIDDTLDYVLGSLRLTPLDDAHEKLTELDPLIVHCLSESDDIVQHVVHALVAYRKHCLRADVDEEAMGAEQLESLNAVLKDFASLPSLAADFATSRSHLILRMRDGLLPLHGSFCDECADDSEETVRGDLYTCIDCPDFDYCSGCYDAHWQEHDDGEHRFVLRRYPTSNTVFKRVTAPLKKLTGDANPWKIEDPPVPDVATPRDDEDEVEAIVTEGSPVMPPPTEDIAGHDCRGSCQRPIPAEGLVYRCLTCQYTTSHDGSDWLLCHDCAFLKLFPGEHRPTHILAVIHKLAPTGPPAIGAEAEVNPLQGLSAEVASAASIEDLSRRMEKIEETIATLLSMVGKLQEVILTSTVRET